MRGFWFFAALAAIAIGIAYGLNKLGIGIANKKPSVTEISTYDNSASNPVTDTQGGAGGNVTYAPSTVNASLSI